MLYACSEHARVSFVQIWEDTSDWHQTTRAGMYTNISYICKELLHFTISSYHELYFSNGPAQKQGKGKGATVSRSSLAVNNNIVGHWNWNSKITQWTVQEILHARNLSLVELQVRRPLQKFKFRLPVTFKIAVIAPQRFLYCLFNELRSITTIHAYMFSRIVLVAVSLLVSAKTLQNSEI